MSERRRRPGKRLLLWLAGGLVALGVAAFLLIYFVVFPTSSPKPFTLSTSTGTAASGAAGSSAAGTTSAATGASGGASTATGASPSGAWTVSSGSQAGYRVREKLAFLPAESDAVGRTSQITGRASFASHSGTTTIESASFVVAVNTLKSDRSMRDEKIHEIGLESNTYPTATFSLSTPVTVPAAALKGGVARTPVTGVFTIHGVSKKETVPVEMSLAGTTFGAVGSLTFPWSEFGMTAPSVGGFVNVSEKATMEFDLRLRSA